ncbi:MAG: LysM peptidoglycan-binding domain-containing protein [Mycobacterium sp.]|uniref:LysM peptidoglycan-binding domain-containing protein n=1 Tax=Mycobacterium sp. TaxID=1785 RepID=UPI001EB9424A|nr:LysM peptidoglycan-binding domain-containing protein [Mycobacterium sp.]MBW0017882.1 LysM peptidoglycan-binding domain-containing protein [Mycobacterium sp.]
MTVIQSVPPRPANFRRPISTPGYGRPGYRTLERTRRPGPPRPAGAPPRYHGTGVAMSTAPHRTRPIRLATTVGLALAAGVITLWLGMVAHLGEVINSDANSTPVVPTKLSLVRVEAGESLQDLAARVAPGVPIRQEAERIRELNSLQSPTLAVGQTLIAPVG